MPKAAPIPPAAPLRALREQAGLPVRELARQLGIHHSNIVYWEKTGRVAKVEVLPALAAALGVSVEEILGAPPARRAGQAPASKLGRLFASAARLPRRQQQKIVELLEPFVHRHAGAAAAGR